MTRPRPTARAAAARRRYPRGESATSSPPSDVVRREEVRGHRLALSAARAELEPLVEPADAPLEREPGRVLLRAPPGEPERVHEVTAEHVALAVAGQLEDAAPDGDHPPRVVGHDEARIRAGVVVLHQLEQETETAAPARHRVLGHSLETVVVDRALLAVRADEVRHAATDGSAGAPRLGGLDLFDLRPRSGQRVEEVAFLLGEEPLRVERRHAPGARRRDGLPIDVILHVAGGEDTVDVRLGRARPR